MKFQWPFMLKSDHEKIRQENVFLRGALYEANKELKKHRKLIALLRDADPRDQGKKSTWQTWTPLDGGTASADE